MTRVLTLLLLASVLGCAMSHGLDDGSDDPDLARLWDVELNDCSCPGLSSFFDADVRVELRTESDELCWVAGSHSGAPACFDARVEGDRIVIDAWDVGCAATPCDAVLAEENTSLVATCTEGLIGSTCRVVLSAATL